MSKLLNSFEKEWGANQDITLNGNGLAGAIQSVCGALPSP